MKKILNLLLSFVILFFCSCQQDEFFTDEVQNNYNLKGALITNGTYQGTYSGGDWLISLPDDWNS